MLGVWWGGIFHPPCWAQAAEEAPQGREFRSDVAAYQLRLCHMSFDYYINNWKFFIYQEIIHLSLEPALVVDSTISRVELVRQVDLWDSTEKGRSPLIIISLL